METFSIGMVIGLIIFAVLLVLPLIKFLRRDQQPNPPADQPAAGAPAPAPPAAPVPAPPAPAAAAAIPTATTPLRRRTFGQVVGMVLWAIIKWTFLIVTGAATVALITWYDAWTTAIPILVVGGGIIYCLYKAGKAMKGNVAAWVGTWVVTPVIFLGALLFILFGTDLSTRGVNAGWDSARGWLASQLDGAGSPAAGGGGGRTPAALAQHLPGSPAAGGGGGGTPAALRTPPALNADAVTMTWSEATSTAFRPLPRERGCLRWTIDTLSQFRGSLPAGERPNATSQFGWEARGGGFGPKPATLLQNWVAQAGSAPTVFVRTFPC